MTTQAATTRSGGIHVVMMVHNDVTRDSRVRKEAIALAAAGLQVTVLAAASTTAPRVEALGDAVIIRVPIDHRLQDQLRLRRARWRRRGIPIVSYRDRQTEAAARLRNRLRFQEVKADSGRAVARREQGTIGAGRFAAGTLARQLRRAGLRVQHRVIRTRVKATQQYARAVGAAWSRWDSWYQEREFRSRWRKVLPGLDDYETAFGPVLDSLRPDAIHAHDVQVLGIAARAAGRARLAGRPVSVVYDSHEFVAGLPKYASRKPRYGAAFEDLEAEYAADAQRIITVSPAIADALTKRYRLAHRPEVVLNTPSVGDAGAVVPRLRDAAGVGEDTPLLVYSGGLTHVRGINVAIGALHHLPDDVHLAIVCVPHNDTPFVHQLRQQTVEAGLGERVHFVNPVGPNEVVAYLASADIGVHPLLGGILNHEMALPNKLFEYIHAGLPVAVSDLQELGRFVREHHVGEAFPSGDAEALAATITRMLADLEPYRRAVRDPRLRDTFSWARQAEVLYGVYADLFDLSPQLPAAAAEVATDATDVAEAGGLSQPVVARPARLLIGPFNMAGQAWAWARSVERWYPGVEAEAMMTGDRTFRADRVVDVDVYKADMLWQLGELRRVLVSASHVLLEAGKPLSGSLTGGGFLNEVETLRAAGITVGTVFHGSELRLPSLHRETYRYSPFSQDEEHAARIEKVAKSVVNQLAKYEGPIFVSTPDLIDFEPRALWLPVVVDADRLVSDSPVLIADRPVVVFAPTNGWLKGAAFIDPVLQEMHARGSIVYRRIEGGLSHDELIEMLRSADVVVDQLCLGSYGVTAVEAMAAGRVTVAHVAPHVRERIPAELPVLEAHPDDFREVMERIVAERDDAIKKAATGPDYVRRFHDGRESARILSEVLGLEH